MKPLRQVAKLGKYLYGLRRQLRLPIRYLRSIHKYLIRYSMGIPIIIFILIWHPGLNSRHLPQEIFVSKASKAISPRPKIYPVESVRLIVDQKKSWITLIMSKKKIASYPITLNLLPTGHYRIVDIRYVNNKVIAVIGNATSDICIMLHSRFYAESNTHSIMIDDDFWESLYPYLRVFTPVHIL